MGLEDYRVVLKPKPAKSIFPEDRAGKAAGRGEPLRRATPIDVVRVLERAGFARQELPHQVGPARLAAPAENEIRLTARQWLDHAALETAAGGEYIVEALIRGHEDPRAAEPVFDSLSMRFAICQPEGAAWHFLKMVKRLCDVLSLAVVQGERTYSPEAFWAFRLRANEQIRNQQAQWRALFHHDPDQSPLAVEDTWGHFLKKHPALKGHGDRTTDLTTPAPQPCADIDLEETLAPKAVKVAVVRRDTAR